MVISQYWLSPRNDHMDAIGWGCNGFSLNRHLGLLLLLVCSLARLKINCLCSIGIASLLLLPVAVSMFASSLLSPFGLYLGIHVLILGRNQVQGKN